MAGTRVRGKGEPWDPQLPWNLLCLWFRGLPLLASSEAMWTQPRLGCVTPGYLGPGWWALGNTFKGNLAAVLRASRSIETSPVIGTSRPMATTMPWKGQKKGWENWKRFRKKLTKGSKAYEICLVLGIIRSSMCFTQGKTAKWFGRNICEGSDFWEKARWFTLNLSDSSL